MNQDREQNPMGSGMPEAETDLLADLKTYTSNLHEKVVSPNQLEDEEQRKDEAQEDQKSRKASFFSVSRLHQKYKANKVQDSNPEQETGPGYSNEKIQADPADRQIYTRPIAVKDAPEKSFSGIHHMDNIYMEENPVEDLPEISWVRDPEPTPQASSDPVQDNQSDQSDMTSSAKEPSSFTGHQVSTDSPAFEDPEILDLPENARISSSAAAQPENTDGAAVQKDNAAQISQQEQASKKKGGLGFLGRLRHQENLQNPAEQMVKTTDSTKPTATKNTPVEETSVQPAFADQDGENMDSQMNARSLPGQRDSAGENLEDLSKTVELDHADLSKTVELDQADWMQAPSSQNGKPDAKNSLDWTRTENKKSEVKAGHAASRETGASTSAESASDGSADPALNGSSGLSTFSITSAGNTSNGSANSAYHDSYADSASSVTAAEGTSSDRSSEEAEDAKQDQEKVESRGLLKKIGWFKRSNVDPYDDPYDEEEDSESDGEDVEDPRESEEKDAQPDKDEDQEDWTDQVRRIYDKHPSIWIRPWIYIVLIAACFVVWLLSEMSSLGLYEFSYPMMIFAVCLVILGIAGFGMIYSKKWFIRAAAVLMCLGVVVYSVMGIHAASSLSGDVKKMANPKTPISIPASIYYYKQAPVTSLEGLNGHIIGVLSKNKDINKEIQQRLKDDNIHARFRSFDSFTSMMLALRGQAIRAVALTGTDPLVADEFAGLENTSQQLAVLESFPSAEPLYNLGSQTDPSTSPFTILLSGQMDPADGSSVRSYLNMVVAVNPITHTILKVYVPRNTKLPVVCENGLGCLPDEKDKVSLASYHSILALKDTLKQALNVNIDFTMQVDVDWMIAGLDPQTVLPIEELKGYGAITKADSGISKDFNGLSARKLQDAMQDFSSADLEYEAGQLDLMMYLLTDYLHRSSKDLNAVLQDLSQCVTTSFTYEQLLHLLQLFALHDYVWDSYGYGITGKESWENSQGLASKAYIINPDDSSLLHASADLQAVLAGEKPSYAYAPAALGNITAIAPTPGENIPNGKDLPRPAEQKPESKPSSNTDKDKDKNKDKNKDKDKDKDKDKEQEEVPAVNPYDQPMGDPNAATSYPGYYDASGGFYDQYGGYWDIYGGYYDAYGNYTNPDGTPGYSAGINYGSSGSYYDPNLYGYNTDNSIYGYDASYGYGWQ